MAHPRGESGSDAEWPDQTFDQAFGLPEVLVAVSTRLSCKRAAKTRTLAPVWDSSADSRPDDAAGASCRKRAEQNLGLAARARPRFLCSVFCVRIPPRS